MSERLYGNACDMLFEGYSSVSMPEGSELVLGWCEHGGYEGDAAVLYRANGSPCAWQSSHCSCYGVDGPDGDDAPCPVVDALSPADAIWLIVRGGYGLPDEEQVPDLWLRVIEWAGAEAVEAFMVESDRMKRDGTWSEGEATTARIARLAAALP